MMALRSPVAWGHCSPAGDLSSKGPSETQEADGVSGPSSPSPARGPLQTQDREAPRVLAEGLWKGPSYPQYMASQPGFSHLASGITSCYNYVYLTCWHIPQPLQQTTIIRPVAKTSSALGPKRQLRWGKKSASTNSVPMLLYWRSSHRTPSHEATWTMVHQVRRALHTHTRPLKPCSPTHVCTYTHSTWERVTRIQYLLSTSRGDHCPFVKDISSSTLFFPLTK